jgi:hypothetical protein
MDNPTNGWDLWYARLDPDWADDVIPLADLQAWGEEFQRLFRLTDHSGYSQTEPMALEDGMTMAFELDQAGVSVESVLELCRAYSPFEMADVVSIPLCFLLDPLGHVDGLLEQSKRWQMSDPDSNRFARALKQWGACARRSETLLAVLRDD